MIYGRGTSDGQALSEALESHPHLLGAEGAVKGPKTQKVRAQLLTAENLRQTPSYQAIVGGLLAESGLNRQTTLSTPHGDVVIRIESDTTEEYREGSQANPSTLVDHVLQSVDPRGIIGLSQAIRETDGIQTLKINSLLRKRGGTSAHDHGRGIDINMINGKRVNNSGYNNKNFPKKSEPALIEKFTDNLEKTKVFNQIFTPWRVKYRPWLGFQDNRYYSSAKPTGLSAARNNNNYRHHIHVGVSSR